MVYRSSPFGISVRVGARLYRSARSPDEDTVLVAELPHRGWLPPPVDEAELHTGSGLVLGVFDGTGPAVSRWVAAALFSLLNAPLSPMSVGAMRGRLCAAMEETARRVWAARESRALRGTRSTATVAAVVGRSLVLAHVGDSRAFLLRHDQLAQISRDDTMLQRIVERASDPFWTSGEPQIFGRSVAMFDEIMLRKLAESDEELNRHARTVMCAMGEREDIEPFVEVFDLCRGDVLVLGTSGLCDWLEDVAVHAPPIQRKGPGAASESFMKQAVEDSKGAFDVGVVVACFDDPTLPLPTPEDVIADRSALLQLEALLRKADGEP